MIGMDKTKLGSIRYSLMKKLIQHSARTALYLSGHVFHENENLKVDYRPYLGPDWVASGKEGAIVIGNHQSDFDTAAVVINYFPRFIAKSMVKDLVAVGSMADAMDCIYIFRDSKDSR
jgi:1-acyl-sn-glycerol-3-phosphate acyltransferase